MEIKQLDYSTIASSTHLARTHGIPLSRLGLTRGRSDDMRAINSVLPVPPKMEYDGQAELVDRIILEEPH